MVLQLNKLDRKSKLLVRDCSGFTSPTALFLLVFLPFFDLGSVFVRLDKVGVGYLLRKLSFNESFFKNMRASSEPFAVCSLILSMISSSSEPCHTIF